MRSDKRSMGIMAFRVRAALCALPLLIAASAHGEESAEPDAVIELWQQEWTFNDDGSRDYHEKKHVRLNNSRVFGQFGDVRIPFDVARDEVKIIAARTRRPDGQLVPTPDYAHIIVSPGGAAGWPAFATARQQVLVLSGIEPGGVVELEYSIHSKPAPGVVFAQDIPLDNEYPIQVRTITATVAPKASFTPALAGIEESKSGYTLDGGSNGVRRHSWNLVNLPAAHDEPQDLPWRQRRPRLCFTTAPDKDRWLPERLAQVEAAADESPLISRLAQEWTRGAATNGERIAAIQRKLAETTNAVSFDVDARPAPRRASETLNSGYGLPDELAAALLSLLRAGGVAPARIGALVSQDDWSDAAPQEAMIAAWAVVVGSGKDAEIWRPAGRVTRGRDWAGYTLLSAGASGLERVELPAWTRADESGLRCAGELKLSAEGTLSGKLHFTSGGLFVDIADLSTKDDQSNRARELVRRVIPGLKVSDFTVSSLAPGSFEFVATVESEKPLEKAGSDFILRLGDDPLLAEQRLPLTESKRLNAARCAGAAHESIELSIELPADCKVAAQPVEQTPVRGAWGMVSQGVNVVENRIRLSRQARFEHRDWPAAELLEARTPLNRLRSEAGRTFMLRP